MQPDKPDRKPLSRRLLEPRAEGGIQPIAVIATFVLFLVLGFIFPYTGDDWTWGSHVGLDRMADGFFAGYNGRYLGNLSVLLLTRVLWLRAICMAVVMTGIVYGAYSFVNRNDRRLYWLMLLLVLFMQHFLRAQGIVWTSGFTNYSIPIVGFIGWMNVFRGVFEDGYEPIARKWAVPLAVLGLCLCLFLETMTLLVVIASAALVIYARKRHDRWDIAQIAFFAGAVVGTVIMFANSSYHEASAFHSMTNMGEGATMAGTIAKFGYEGYALNVAPNLCFAIIAILLVRKSGWREARKLDKLVMLAAIILACYSAFRTLYSVKVKILLAGDVLAFGVFVIVALLLAVSLWRRRKEHKPLFVLACAAAVTAPLLVVSPVTWRCFYPEYLFYAIFLCSLVDAGDIGGRVPARVLAAICAVGFAMWFIIYGTVFSVYCHRGADIEQQLSQSAETIVLERLPYAEHIQHNDSIIESNDFNMRERFRIYYDIPKGVKIKFE